MRLFSLTGAASVDDPEYGHFEPDAAGGFVFPGPLSDKLHRVHIGGQQQWETEIEQGRRVIAEDLARRQSPEALYDAVARLVGAAGALAPVPVAKAEPEPKAAPKAAPAAKAAGGK